MTSKKKYKLEYWIDLSIFNKDDFDKEISNKLNRLDVEKEITEKRKFYSLKIEGDQYNIDACYDKIEFERDGVFRANDELGDELRGNAYKILSEIETELRKFISKTMIEVAGFAWWDQLIPENLRERAIKIERSSGKNEVKLHHPIEFTMFDGLIEIVTAEYTEWSKEKPLTVSDLEQLLNKNDSIEKLKDELANKSKTISIWEDVFSNYFDDQETWNELKEKIKNRVIPIRNKVMHHRLLRVYEVNQLDEYRTQLHTTIRSSKRKMTKEKLSEAFKKWSNIFEENKFQIDPEVLKAISRPIIPHETIKAMQEIGAINKSVLQKFLDAKEFQKLYFGNPHLNTDSSEDNNEDEDEHDEDKNDDSD